MVLRNVLHVPRYEVNLLSVNRSVKFGHKFMFKYVRLVHLASNLVNLFPKSLKTSPKNP